MEKLRQEFQTPRYELLPFKGQKTTEEWNAIPEGATVTVTCSQKTGQERTIERAEFLASSDKNLKVIPHLSARAIESTGQLDAILGRLDDAGIDSAFVVGGDAKDSGDIPFHNSLELIRAIREQKSADELELGCTAYPDGHIDIDRETLTSDLLEKQKLVGYCATQLCFSPSKIVKWSYEMQDAGLEIPIKVGIPGSIERKKLLRIVQQVGISDTTSFLRKNLPLMTRFVMPGGYNPNRMIRGLKSHIDSDASLIDGFHINTFNDIITTEKWRQGTLASKKYSRK